MNLKNKSDKELWDMLDNYQGMLDHYALKMEEFGDHKYEIHQEIIKRKRRK